MSTPEQKNGAEGSVSRGAFWGGLLAGAVVLAVGFTIVPRLGLSKVASVPVEMLCMGVALWIVTRTWARSASPAEAARDAPERPPGLDSAPGDADRGEKG